MDELDQLIEDVVESAQLGADALNALHGATSNHPWCADKSLSQRKLEVLFAIEGRGVNSKTLREIRNLNTGE